ncbi:MAG: CAP domain-containing protein [Chitinophagaceae bacterium]|nr:CAP domain-containing protein [Chitinophagaceae bacterium]
MKQAILFTLLSLSIFSCQKNDLSSPEETPTEEATSYKVNKATLLQLVNNVRAAGCTCGSTVMPPVSPVTWNDLLAKAAYGHSLDMMQKNYFNHTGSDGSDAGQRITAAGYVWTAYGENIANGYPNETAVMNGWLNSEGHCKNIMNAAVIEMGAGREANYWTQLFGRR